MLVGEAWEESEERSGRPFVGYSGEELNRMLHEAGLMRSECFVSNVVNAHPPGNDLRHFLAFSKSSATSVHKPWRGWWATEQLIAGHAQLMREIALVQPNVVVAFGNLALHALKVGCISMKPTGPSGILKWRGSQLRCDETGIAAGAPGSAPGLPPKLIPTLHPAAILRDWSNRGLVVQDLRRAARHTGSREYSLPEKRYIVRPSLTQVTGALETLWQRLESGQELWLDLDLETRAGHIACLGISWSRTEGICIPFMCTENREGYWLLEEETYLVRRLAAVLQHPRVQVRWQNGLYDAQYIDRHWLFVPRGSQDTMISHHSIFSDRPKALHFQASMYCENYVYWKDEGKTWNRKMPEEQLWGYNLDDCTYTRECGEVEIGVVAKLGLEKVHQFQQAMFWPVLKAMRRGIRVIKENRERLAMEVQEQIAHREQFLNDMVGFPVNLQSPKQMQDLFYSVFQQPKIFTRAKKGIPGHLTCDDEALSKIGAREPLLKPLTNAIQDTRTLEKYLDVILMKLDRDGRARCSFNIGGSESGKSAPKTFRLSSSKSAFGSGVNMQNISSEKSKSVGKALQRGHVALMGDPYQYPNVRSVFGPDWGKTFFDIDLDRADLQVFVWEIDDPVYKELLRKKVDAHLFHVYLLDGKEPPPLDELVETHPKYWDHRGPRKHKREFSKVFCHAVDYVGGTPTIAAAVGRTRHEVDRARKLYLAAHPRIEPYWRELENQVSKRRYVENKFGYRWYIFDRIDQTLPEAVAWIPQSTVSIVINRIWMCLFQDRPEDSLDLSRDYLWSQFHRPTDVEVLLQVHDSLGGQFPTHKKESIVPRILELSKIKIPYDDPLVIPTGIGTSEVSWGEC